jgi:predicted secreted Zn-dependent protease
MTKLKMLTAAAVLSTLAAAPAMAQDTVVVHRHHVYHDRGPVGAAADTAAGIAGAAIGTAGAIATAPFRNSYNYTYDRGYDDRYVGSYGYACRPGTWFRGDDGLRHFCR